MKQLTAARATEPMLFNGLTFIRAEYKKLQTKKFTRLGGTDVKTLKTKLFQACRKYIGDIETEEAIRPLIWAKLIKSWYHILTHCHSGSVVKILTTAWKQGKKIHVYNTETRPLYQGRRTSKDLLQAGVPDTMITDDAAPFFVDNLYESDVHIDMVIMGCDDIKTNGDIYNKVGSFAIALAAWHSKIPVYIVGSLTKINPDNKIKIEKRSGKELRPDAPKGLEILNYAFDMVPAKFITWIITDYGVLKPREIGKYLKKYYPRMRK